MTTDTRPTPRDIRPEDAEAMRDCLIWLGDGQFIEDRTIDIYADTVVAFGKAHGTLIKVPQGRAIMAFLAWMDGVHRLRTVGPANPYGTNIEFYSSDYPSARECAEAMVRSYREGE